MPKLPLYLQLVFLSALLGNIALTSFHLFGDVECLELVEFYPPLLILNFACLLFIFAHCLRSGTGDMQKIFAFLAAWPLLVDFFFFYFYFGWPNATCAQHTKTGQSVLNLNGSMIAWTLIYTYLT